MTQNSGEIISWFGIELNAEISKLQFEVFKKGNENSFQKV